MQIEETEVIISTPDGQMPAFLYSSAECGQQPGVILLMEAFGLTPHIRNVAARIANEGYVVLTPDLYYRELPNNKFEYSEVEQGMAMMYRMDFGKPVEIESRFKELGKEYTLKVYPDADHGFFCCERSSYNPLAAEDSWHELTQFFNKHLQKSV